MNLREKLGIGKKKVGEVVGDAVEKMPTVKLGRRNVFLGMLAAVAGNSLSGYKKVGNAETASPDITEYATLELNKGRKLDILEIPHLESDFSKKIADLKRMITKHDVVIFSESSFGTIKSQNQTQRETLTRLFKEYENSGFSDEKLKEVLSLPVVAVGPKKEDNMSFFTSKENFLLMLLALKENKKIVFADVSMGWAAPIPLAAFLYGTEKLLLSGDKDTEVGLVTAPLLVEGASMHLRVADEILKTTQKQAGKVDSPDVPKISYDFLDWSNAQIAGVITTKQEEIWDSGQSALMITTFLRGADLHRYIKNPDQAKIKSALYPHYNTLVDHNTDSMMMTITRKDVE